MPYDPQDLPQPTRQTTRSAVEINEAIERCAVSCDGKPDAFACCEAYAIALIGDGWSAEDARAVQVGALRCLSKLTGDDSLWPTT